MENFELHTMIHVIKLIDYLLKFILMSSISFFENFKSVYFEGSKKGIKKITFSFQLVTFDAMASNFDKKNTVAYYTLDVVFF
jgi:hypothetical protein